MCGRYYRTADKSALQDVFKAVATGARDDIKRKFRETAAQGFHQGPGPRSAVSL